MSDNQHQVVQLFKLAESQPNTAGVQEAYEGYRHRPNQDLRGVLDKRRDAYSAIAYGYRLVFLLDADTYQDGREVYKIFPISLQSVHFEKGRLVIDDVRYDNREDERFYIPLAHVLGRGDLWDSPDRLSEKMLDVYDDMVKVLQAAIAYDLQRH